MHVMHLALCSQSYLALLNLGIYIYIVTGEGGEYMRGG